MKLFVALTLIFTITNPAHPAVVEAGRIYKWTPQVSVI